MWYSMVRSNVVVVNTHNNVVAILVYVLCSKHYAKHMTAIISSAVNIARWQKLMSATRYKQGSELQATKVDTGHL